MKIIINFFKGLKTTGKTTRMVLFLFIINLLFSMLLAIPMYNSLKNSFGHSEVGEKMAEGFDYLWWQEFRDEAQGLETTFTPSIIGKGAVLNNLVDLIQLRIFDSPPIIIIFVFFYITLHTFLAGGILSTFYQDNPKFTMKGFAKGAGSYFFRFFILMLISWVMLFTITAVLGSIFSPILDIAFDNSQTEVTPFYLVLLFSGIIFFIFLFFQMLFDYARIKIVLEERRNVLIFIPEAFSFVFKFPFSTLGLYFLIFLISIVATLVYILLKDFIPQSSYLGVSLAFFLQQVFIFSVIWLRCCLYSSQMNLYRYLR